jgi:hypothetical protein
LILFCTGNRHSLTADLTERKPRPGKSVIGGLRSPKQWIERDTREIISRCLAVGSKAGILGFLLIWF